MNFKILTKLSILLFSHLTSAQDLIFKAGFEFIPGLNDTGITWGGDYTSGNNATCTSNITSHQDCHQGRDAKYNDDSDGHAGFSFTKLDASGNPLIDQSVDYATAPWACVKDNVTGLVWEVKTVNVGLHNKDDRYNWYNTDSTTNGGADGFADDDGAICYGYNVADSSTYCNTLAFATRVNAQGLCGQTDWRVPDINELHSIVHQGKINLAIDENYFPNTASGWFWSSNPNAESSSHAWILNFGYGYDGIISRSIGSYVRLVRGRQ